MPRPRIKKLVHLEVTGLAPLPPAMDDWERALIEPALTRLLETPKPSGSDTKEARHGEEAR